MELRHYFTVLRRGLVLVLVTIAVAVGVAVAVTPKTHKYSTRAVIYVGASKFSVSTNDQYLAGLVDRLMQTYANMLDSEPIAADAVRATGAPRTPTEVVKETKVQPETNTQLLTVTVTDRSPAAAQQLANGIADAFMRRASAANAQPGPGSLPSLPAYIFQRADLPSSPDPTGLVRNALLAGFFGLLVAVGVVFLRDYLDLTLKTVAEAENRLRLPVLGFIPYDRERANGGRSLPVVVAATPRVEELPGGVEAGRHGR